MSRMRYLLMLLIVSVATGGLWADANVQLTDLGGTVVLDNGIVSLEIDKDVARIVSLKKGEQELMGNGGVAYHQRISYDDPCNPPGHPHDKFTTPENCTYSVVRNTPDLVEISLVENDPSHYPLYFDSHFVLKKGESGYYNFVVLEFRPWQVSWASLMQLNLCTRLDASIFQIEQVKDDRWQVMPTPQDIADSTVVMDATHALLPTSAYAQTYDDPVYTKYNMIVQHDNHYVHGTCSNGSGYGVWVVRPSAEYLNGVPATQELTLQQTDTTVVMLGTYQGVHFGSEHLFFDTDDGHWRKVFGPQFFYVNQGGSREAMWQDAKNQATQHVAQWPYQWMVDADYPLVRGTVRGQVAITDGTNPEGALVVLAQPVEGETLHWQKQGKDYVFHGRVGSDGTFNITDVRAGTYTVYVSTNGLLDEFAQDGVVVTAGAITDVGLLEWEPVKYGRTAWQLGIADRDSTEFKSGDDFRHWGGEMRARYEQGFPNHINFEIGVDDWATDWNYGQMNVDSVGTTWNLKFNIDKPYTGTAYLRVAFAGTRDSILEIRMGRRLLADWDLDLGQGYPRSGSKGYYEERVVPIDASYFVVGDNVLSFRQTRGGDWPCIHYDCIRLELPYQADMNDDLQVDLADFSLFAGQWLPGGLAADFNADGVVDQQDMVILTQEWLD